jgi:hypothetical protein
LENQVEVWNAEKVKTEPDEFEDEDKKPLEDKVGVEDLMLVRLKRLKPSLKSLNFRFGFNF